MEKGGHKMFMGWGRSEITSSGKPLGDGDMRIEVFLKANDKDCR